MKGDDIYVFLRLVKKSIQHCPAPVLGYLAEQGSDPFKILIFCVLSLRTRDQTTSVAGKRLFAISPDPYLMGEMNLQAIEDAIFPVAFFRVKAKQIQRTSQKICQDFQGITP